MSIDCMYCLSMPDQGQRCHKCETAKGTTQKKSCSGCDCTGDVHRADGEWLGECQYCRPNKEWVENVEYLLKNCPYTVHMHEGGGPENLVLSLIVTFTKMQHRLKEIDK